MIVHRPPAADGPPSPRIATPGDRRPAPAGPASRSATACSSPATGSARRAGSSDAALASGGGRGEGRGRRAGRRRRRDGDDVFAECRPRLLGVAYGMLGELGEAEDVVQDAWLRWDAADDRRPSATPRRSSSPSRRGWRSTGCGRRAPGARPTSARGCPSRCSSTRTTPDPSRRAIEAEQLSLALLGALERLNPVERAVLVLRDVFDLEYAEIADAVEKTPANCRQIAKRAREHAGDAGPPLRGRRPSRRQRLIEAFMVGGGDRRRRGRRATCSPPTRSCTPTAAASSTPRASRSTARRRSRASSSASSARTTTRTDIDYTPVRVNGDPGRADGRAPTAGADRRPRARARARRRSSTSTSSATRASSHLSHL